MGYTQAFPSQNQECLLEGMKRIFEHMGGVAEKDQLEITQWFFQTCFKTKLWITRTGDELHIKVRKERLHDDWPYIWSEAIMQREQQ